MESSKVGALFPDRSGFNEWRSCLKFWQPNCKNFPIPTSPRNLYVMKGGSTELCSGSQPQVVFGIRYLGILYEERK